MDAVTITIKHTNGITLYVSEGAGSQREAVEEAVRRGANLQGANLQGANLRDANLGGADLRDAYLGGANLRGANLWGANLRGADLRNANLRGADLGDAYLGGADLRDTYLGGANLRGAHLGGADLGGADLGDAYLRDANLRGANLRGADLRNANLRGADLWDTIGILPERTSPLHLYSYQLPNTELVAFKLVNAQGEGPYNGGIVYTIGKTVEVQNANTDATEDCAEGINVATLDWCLRNWQEGYRILRVAFTTTDIAAIPTATDGKFRLHRCRVVDEVDLTVLGVGA